MRKILCGVLCASILATGFPMSASANFRKESVSVGIMAGAAEEEQEPPGQEGQEQVKEGLIKENGSYHYYEDGKLVKKSWKTVNGKKYYFKKDGNAATLNYKISGKYYIFNNNGQLFQPASPKVVKVETGKGEYKRFYVNSNGTAASGWAENKTYYFYDNCEMATGIIVLKDTFYVFKDSGKLNTAKTKKFKKAAKYEKPVADLLKLLGKPKKTKYTIGCYGDGKDGVWTYDNFKVFTYKPKKGAEIFMGAE